MLIFPDKMSKKHCTFGVFSTTLKLVSVARATVSFICLRTFLAFDSLAPAIHERYSDSLDNNKKEVKCQIACC